MANNNLRDTLTPSRIGKRCHFTHPDTGKVIEGIYGKGRTVRVLTGMKPTHGPDGSRSYDVEETIYTVPRHVRITFGQAVDRG
jgi:hypothetical protein